MRQETHLSQDIARRQQAGAMKRARMVAVIVALVLLAGAVRAVFVRVAQADALQRQSADAQVQTVRVATPTRGKSVRSLTLPGTLQGMQESPIYARTSGYVKRWTRDIGSRVRKGDVLAEIDTPEVDQELLQAEAARQQVEARLALATSSAERWKQLRAVNAVSQQELDERQSAAMQAQADLAASDANVRRLRQLQSFRQVSAPFDGVVVRRNVEVGDLINAGNAGANRELFRIAQTDPLRLYVSVPQSYAPQIKAGMPARIELRESAGKTYTGKVARSAGAIDPASRTMQVEITQPNPDGSLLPGAYVQVSLSVDMPSSLLVPSNALLFRKDGPSVAVVQDGAVHLVPVTIGLDYGRSLQITSGLQGNEQVILNPSDSIDDGQRVSIVPADKPVKR